MNESNATATTEILEANTQEVTPKQDPKPAEVMYTREQYNQEGKAGKLQGKKDALKAIGIDPKGMTEAEITQAFTQISEMRTQFQAAENEKLTESQRREESDRKNQSALDEATRKVAEAEARAAYLEQQLAIRLAGVTDEDYFDAIIKKVSPLVTESVDFSAALKTFLAEKGNEKYTASAQAPPTRTVTASTDEGGGANITMTKEDFKKLTYAEEVELKKNNPTLYAALTKK